MLGVTLTALQYLGIVVVVEDHSAGQQGGEAALGPVFIDLFCKMVDDSARQYLKQNCAPVLFHVLFA